MACSLPLRISLIITVISAALTLIILLVSFFLIGELNLNQLNHLPLNRLAILAVAFLVLLPPVFILSRILAGRLLRPLQTLTEKTRSYSTDGSPVSFLLDSDDEFAELGKALQEMQENLSDSHAQLEMMAFRDPLTGLSNRRGLHQELSKLILWARQQENRIALLYIDLDHFKQINDSSSHAYGDQILREIAQRLLQVVKQQTRHSQLPFPEELLLSRPGGDQFIIMLPDIGQVEQAGQLSHHIIEAIQQPFQVSDRYFKLSCSIGITLYPDDANSAERMLKHADIAMYEAKRSGRNRSRYFLPAMHRQVEERVMIQQGISTAIAENQLYIEYQPIVHMKKKRVVGAEALLRWHHPKRGRLGPETFIPVIEESDQIGALTVWIIETVAAELRLLPSQKEATKLSINISSAILNKPELAQQVNDALLRVDAPDHRICLEITETSLMEDIDNTLPLLLRWKDAGYSIWIDDFGTGYSSLSYLARLPIDGVKIDRSFIRDFDNSKPVIEAIIALADTMNLLTVSEGVEQAEQQQSLLRLGCDFAQGYLYSEPLSISLLTDKLEQQLLRESRQTLKFRPRSKTKLPF
ncbi:putative bifunctional diguanylate cyclase/phosphodiesterase [Amphritea pacifica]|uniref:putative bifunctional diguanylate cyclase/phosphodiesterase n=1 Tax=Amphritea pacifica TaxID=2811233 RepID=UPI001964F533|nr:EAL domain-containing protein [Amphritea pacifica]MBN1008211.1 EAL domain-containing protein [Amphritea pacifica]